MFYIIVQRENNLTNEQEIPGLIERELFLKKDTIL
jgi:hypothetical protein